jgi:hypothetical protein
MQLTANMPWPRGSQHSPDFWFYHDLQRVAGKPARMMAAGVIAKRANQLTAFRIAAGDSN